MYINKPQKYRKKIYLLLLLFHTILSLSFSQKISVYGVISDSITGEFISDANVRLLRSNITTTSNNYGFYSLPVNAGQYEIIISCIGYKSDTLKVSINKTTSLNIKLSPKYQQIEFVTIMGKGFISDPIMNKNSISAQKINSIPAIFGQPDLLKGLIFLPGIQSIKPGTTSLSIRGGDHSQNLFLLDEAILYNPDHSLSFLSVFNPDAIKDIVVYKAAFPAEFGGRLSSVIDVRMKEGNNQNYEYYGTIGLLASSFTCEGPFIKIGKGSFLLSSRYSYIGQIANGLYLLKDIVYPLRNMPNHNKIWFYDLNFKLNYSYNSKNKLFISGYSGKDEFFFRIISTNSLLKWGNNSLTIRHNHIFNSLLFVNNSLIFSSYQYQYLHLDDQRDYLWKSILREYQLKSDFDWYLSNRQSIKFGLYSNFHIISPGSLSKASENSTIKSFALDKRNSIESSIYFSDDISIIQNITISLGLRENLYINVGPGYYYSYNENRTKIIDSTWYRSFEFMDIKHNIEPRLNAVIKINNLNSIKISYCQTSQYLHQISNSSVGLPTDIWIPANKNLDLIKSDIISIGYFKKFINNISFSVELYSRNMHHITDFKDNANIFLNKYIELQILEGRGKAYGLEIQARKITEKYDYSISYTLSSYRQKVQGINANNWFHATYDRLHNLSVNGSYKFRRNWCANSSFLLTSGGYCTMPKEVFDFNGFPFVQYTNRNHYKLPLYHRLDLSLTHSSKKLLLGSKCDWTFGCYNIYNRKNVFSLYVDYNKSGGLTVENLYLFGIVPYINLSFKF